MKNATLSHRPTSFSVYCDSCNLSFKSDDACDEHLKSNPLCRVKIQPQPRHRAQTKAPSLRVACDTCHLEFNSDGECDQHLKLSKPCRPKTQPKPRYHAKTAESSSSASPIPRLKIPTSQYKVWKTKRNIDEVDDSTSEKVPVTFIEYQNYDIHGLTAKVRQDTHMLTFEVVSTPGKRQILGGGRDMFIGLMNTIREHKIPVSAIRGEWCIYSHDSSSLTPLDANLNCYVKNLKSMSPEESAKNTWTGRMAKEFGFNHVKITKPLQYKFNYIGDDFPILLEDIETVKKRLPMDQKNTVLFQKNSHLEDSYYILADNVLHPELTNQADCIEVIADFHRSS